MSKVVRKWYDFLRRQFNATAFRKQDTMKIRRYEHIQIQKEFKKLDSIRRDQRKALLEERKRLLESQINKTKKLLETKSIQEKGNEQKITNEKVGEDLQLVMNEIKALELQIKQQKNDLTEIQEKLEGTQSQTILVHGYQKLVILNSITHQRHLKANNEGYKLHPLTEQAIENIHYLLDHNLPLPKYKLFQIFPEIFVEQIGELEQSIQRLLVERRQQMKVISTPLYGMFELQRDKSKLDFVDLIVQQENDLLIATNNKVLKMLQAHSDVFDKITKGETRFRSAKHFIMECRDVDEEEEFTIEEWNAKQTVIKALQIREEFEEWKRAAKLKIYEYNTTTRWPAYLNHRPDLVELYKKQWERLRSTAVPFSSILIDGDVQPNYLQIKIRQTLQDQTKKRKAQAINGKIDKTISTTDAYKLFTKCLVQVQQQRQIAKQSQLKILSKPQVKPKQLPDKDAGCNISMSQIVKILMLNSQSPSKYNLQFFSRYFGVNPDILKNVLNNISFIARKEQGIRCIKFQ